MSDVFKGVAIMILTGKSYFWVTLVTNAAFALALALVTVLSNLGDGTAACGRFEHYALWTVGTAAVTFGSFLMFTQWAKGSTVSVAGQLIYIVNFVQKLVLFVLV